MTTKKTGVPAAKSPKKIPATGMAVKKTGSGMATGRKPPPNKVVRGTHPLKVAGTAVKSKISAEKGNTTVQSLKKEKKNHKKKVVRDSFTMPQDEYQKIAEIKSICLKSKMHVKKSEILRAGLIVLAGFSVAQLKQTLNSLEKIKTGRPHKHRS